MSTNTDGWLASRVAAPWRRLPRRVRMTVLIVAVIGASFAATILPFVATDRTHSTVEIAGHVPSTARVGVPVSFDLAADNTSDGNVEPLCIRVTSRPGVVTGLRAVFQGLDHVLGTGDRVCGGVLSGSETVSIHVQFTPAVSGGATLRLVATQGDREIGPQRLADVVIADSR